MNGGSEQLLAAWRGIVLKSSEVIARIWRRLSPPLSFLLPFAVSGNRFGTVPKWMKT